MKPIDMIAMAKKHSIRRELAQPHFFEGTRGYRRVVRNRLQRCGKGYYKDVEA